MTQPTVEQIHQRALAGDGDAQFLLARLFDREGKHDIAVGWLRKAAETGHTGSATYLGVRLLSARAAPWSPDEGAALIFAAAGAGGVEAAGRAAALTALGVGARQDWPGALKRLQRAAEVGEPSAQGQLDTLAAEAEFLKRPLDLAALAEPPAAEVAMESPRILVFPKFASPQICDWIVGRAEGRFTAAKVYDAQGSGGQAQNNMRTNTLADFGVTQNDVVTAVVRARIAAAADVPLPNLEAANVLHYEPGQRFDTHYDFIAPHLPQFAEELDRLGQRIATALLYLNEDYEGGETEFVDLKHRYRGAKGDLMIFFNVDPEGRPDLRTAHAGRPPTRGRKLVLSQWIRDRAQPVI